jgi:hypothetical protein
LVAIFGRLPAGGSHQHGYRGVYIDEDLFAIVDGKVQKVVVMRNTWDRAC